MLDESALIPHSGEVRKPKSDSNQIKSIRKLSFKSLYSQLIQAKNRLKTQLPGPGRISKL